MIKNEKSIRKELEKQAKAKDWDDLAHEIMLLETGIKLETDLKYIILLNIKLEIWEREKAYRVSNSFDMGYFLSKDFNEIDSDSIVKTKV